MRNHKEIYQDTIKEKLKRLHKSKLQIIINKKNSKILKIGSA